MFRMLTRGLLLSVLPCALVSADDWPQWRGPDRTDVSQETGLLQSWPEGGPEQVWVSRDAGLGYAGMAVVGDTLYTLGADDETEFVIAMSVSDGVTKWTTQIGERLQNKWGDGPRATPTVDGGYVYVTNGRGNVVCVQAEDGKAVWQVNLTELGGKIPGWGYCESVLVDGDKVVCTPGGKEGAVVALDKSTGNVLWQSTDFTEGAQYASIIKIEHNGKPQYVQLTMSKLAGLDAENGDVLWQSDWTGRTAVIPTPIYHDGHIYITSGYGVGCKLVKLDAEAGPSDVYVNKVMKNHHGGVVLVGDYLYGYSDGPGWICQNFMTGEMVWNEKQSLGKGCVTFADGKLYCVDERNGDVALVDASPEGWNERGRFTIEPQTQQRSPSGRIWTHPTVANGRLYLRDQELVLAYDIKAD